MRRLIMNGRAWSFLEQWFIAQCNEDWEHDLGVVVESLDNPGWMIKIRIEDTNLEGRVRDWVKWDHDEHSWLHWRSTGTMFEAACGPAFLTRALEVFELFASEVHTRDPDGTSPSPDEPRVGTVFGIPISEERFAIGQIVGRYHDGAHRLAVFRSTLALTDGESQTIGALASEAVFIARSYSSYVAVGYWPVFGVQPVSPELFSAPLHALGSEFAPMSSSRPTVLPWKIEEAVNILHGDREWQDGWYHELRPSPH